ncbi:fibroblast growth factor receptor-like [Acanthaster planci]|uniref:receptor protein-tyrosine kinase n=1 Tax=Acanthaster planci TaxID=133434 RepID=A0A8B7Y9I2_ACAPL|nr:fibroblast growth factor receptor-like [Acanthaster planci]
MVLLVWFIIVLPLHCETRRAPSEYPHSAESQAEHPFGRDTSPLDPFRADVLCRARCLAKCLSNNNTVARGGECTHICDYFNSTWLTEICKTVDCWASCDNLTRGSDSLLEKPVLGKPQLADNHLSLRWHRANCTTCHHWDQELVSIIRYRAHHDEWSYEIQTENQTFVMDLEDVCAKFFQIALVSEFGASPSSDMKMLEPIPVIKDSSLTARANRRLFSFKLRLSWETVSGWIPNVHFYLVTLTHPRCKRQPTNAQIMNNSSRLRIRNGEVNLDNEDLDLARGDCEVTYEVHGTFGACYNIQPVKFKYRYVCQEIFRDDSQNCLRQGSSPRLQLTSVSAIRYPHNKSAMVQWHAVDPSPNVNGYIVQWGKVIRNDNSSNQLLPILNLYPETITDISIPGVKNNYVWLTGLEADILYGVRVAINITGAETNLATVPTYSFEISLEAVNSSYSTPLPDEQPTLTIILIVASSLLCVFALCMMLAVVWRCRLRQMESRMSKTRLRRDEESMPNVYTITPSADNPDPPIPDRWEIPFDRLEMGEMLGKGQFGIVMKAFIPGKLSTHYTSGSSLFRDSIKRYDVQVAVKMLHGDADEWQRQEFRHEMKLMKDIGHHSNLVSLLGCCSTDATPLCLIVEHCCHGDLLQYLRAKRGPMERLDHFRMAEKADGTESDPLMPKDLLSFARQIARGMEYLSQKGFVHRDLAARNVMVAEDKTVKIGDFGLTRYVYDDKIYVHRRGGKLPIKWMSVEALNDQVFTTYNDVWSFGVLLFEIVTLGASPYPGIQNEDILGMLKGGYRIVRPENCSEVLYAIMIACWHHFPEDRPTFTDLRHKLEALLEEDTPYLDFCQNYKHYPFFEISEEWDSEEEQEEVGDKGSDTTMSSRARPEVIPMVSIESSEDDVTVLASTPEEVFVELEPMLGTDEGDDASGSLSQIKDTGGQLQKRDSGLGSDYVYSSHNTNMEDIPLIKQFHF